MYLRMRCVNEWKKRFTDTHTSPYGMGECLRIKSMERNNALQVYLKHPFLSKIKISVSVLVHLFALLSNRVLDSTTKLNILHTNDTHTPYNSVQTVQFSQHEQMKRMNRSRNWYMDGMRGVKNLLNALKIDSHTFTDNPHACTPTRAKIQQKTGLKNPKKYKIALTHTHTLCTTIIIIVYIVIEIIQQIFVEIKKQQQE